MVNKIFIAIVFLTTISSFGKTEKNSAHKNRTSSNVNYFSSSAQEIKKNLEHKEFQKYSDYMIESIRQGEVGESQAFFIRLVKPFSAGSDGLCFVFLGTDKLQDQPSKCQKAE